MFNSDQKRAFVAVLLSGIVLFGWQYYFTSKVPAKTEVKVSEPVVATEKKMDFSLDKNAASNLPAPVVINNPSALVETKLESNKNSYVFNSDLTFTNASNDISLFNLQSLTGSSKPFKIQLIQDTGTIDIFFQNEAVDANKMSAVNTEYGIKLSAQLDEKGKLSYSLVSDKPYKLKFILKEKNKKIAMVKFVTS